MKIEILLLFLASASAFYISEGEPGKEEIVGGEYADIEEAPYQAIIYNYGLLYCGATIISEYWLISAAHCVTDAKARNLQIHVGSNKVQGNDGDIHRVERVVVNKKYDSGSSDGDISLIKLKTPIKFNKYQKAIALASEPPKAGQEMTVSGFGRIGSKMKTARRLKIAHVPVVTNNFCQKRYTMDKITDNMFCAGKGLQDACQGDSGGPGVIDNKLAGVISFGIGCASPRYPGVYTRVDKYYDWIINTMKGTNTTTTTTTTAGSIDEEEADVAQPGKVLNLQAIFEMLLGSKSS